MERKWNFICTMIHVGAEVFAIAVYTFTGWRIWRRIKYGRGSMKVGELERFGRNG